MKWEQKRTTANCNNTTPLLIQVKGKPQMIIAGADKLEGLDPANGQPIWWCKTPGFGESPIAASGLVYTAKGGNEPAMLVDPGGQGDVAKTHVKWREAKLPGDYASPVVCGDYICHVQKEGVDRLPGAFDRRGGRHCAAGGRVEAGQPRRHRRRPGLFREYGKKLRRQAGPDNRGPRRRQSGWLGQRFVARGLRGRIFVRDFENLWCIGKK